MQKYRNTHPFRIMVGSMDEGKNYICVSPYFRDVHDLEHSRLYRYNKDKLEMPLIIGTTYLFGRGDAQALALIYSALNKYLGHEIELIEDWQAIEKWNRNMICIGAHNSKTREILSKFDDTFYKFANNYGVIIKSSKEETNGPLIKAIYPKRGDDSSIIDYGLIIKLADEYNKPEKTIFIIAGIGDLGTAGAAYYFSNHFEKLPIHDKKFGVIIQVPSGIESAKCVKFEDYSDYLKTEE
jgi:hypothetical protein